MPEEKRPGEILTEEEWIYNQYKQRTLDWLNQGIEEGWLDRDTALRQAADIFQLSDAYDFETGTRYLQSLEAQETRRRSTIARARVAEKATDVWYRGEERVPIEGRPETLEAYKELTKGLAYLNGEWVKKGTPNAKTAEELGWYAQSALAGAEVSKAMFSARIERAAKERQRQQEWRYTPPSPEYGAVFQRGLAGTTGTINFKDWYEGKYGSIVQAFKTTIPKLKAEEWPGLKPLQVEKKVEETFAEYLKRIAPAQAEEYATRFPYGRGGRPWAYAPALKTVKF